MNPVQQQQSRKRTSKPLKFNPAGLAVSGTPMSFVEGQGGIVLGKNLPVRSATPGSNNNGYGMLKMATVGLLEVFGGCNSTFKFDKALNPRRVLTKPSRPAFNSGFDNEKHDYILYVNDIIGTEEGRKYVILDLLGQGTFGQVVKCQNLKTGELVAVKVIKNQTAYFNQSMMEVTVLELLNGKHDTEDRHHIVRMRDTFIFRQHLCVVVELLSLNLYELIRQNQYRGFSLQLCRVFLAQILDAMRVLKEAKIIHCDLKPENILLKNLDSPAIKVIDYGSACHEQQTLYTYIQSRFYRSPEVLLGLPYTASIDAWSLGCIAAELFLGLPIFPGASNYDQVARIVDTLGVPPNHMIELGRDAALYFDKRYNTDGHTYRYTLKSRERYSMEMGKNEPPSKKYFASTNLEEMILGYPVRPKDMPAAEKEAEMRQRRVFIDFLRGLLKLNPVERWHPQQALQHPFITGKTSPVLPVLSPSPPHPISSPASNRIKIQASAAETRTRPRANTLSSLSLHDVPSQIQKIATATKATGGPQAKPAARQPPPPEAFPAGDVEPPALPFEVGSVPKSLITGKPSIPSVQLAQQQTPRHQPNSSSQAPANYYVDRLAGYATNRRVSNPPGMASGLAIRNRPRFGSRVDSLSLDEFVGPSSLPSASHGAIPMDTDMQPEQPQQQQRRSSRRSSEPFATTSSTGMVPLPTARRKGSLSGPSTLSRSLTMGDGGSTEQVSSASSAISVTSSSQLMDTLEEVSDEEHHHMDID